MFYGNSTIAYEVEILTPDAHKTSAAPWESTTIGHLNSSTPSTSHRNAACRFQGTVDNQGVLAPCVPPTSSQLPFLLIGDVSF